MTTRLLRRALLWLPALLPAYLLRFTIGPLPTTALEIGIVALAVLATAFDRTLWIDGWRKISSWKLPLALWIVATLVAVAVAPNHLAALGLWRAYILEPLIYFVLLAGILKTEQDRREVIQALIAATVAVCAVSIFQFATGQYIPHPWDTAIDTRRATSVFPFPNAVSLFVAPIAVLCVSLLTLQKTKDKTFITWLFAGAISGIGATLLAKSAGGTIAILVASSLALILNKKTRLWTLGALVIGTTVAFGVPQIRTPLVRLLTFQDWSGKVRLIIWKETENMLKDHPVFGAGLGAYPDVIVPYHKATFIEIFQYPHTILLNLWSETGLLGIAAFIWICVVWFRRGVKDQTVSPYVFPLIAILVHGLVDVPYFKNDLAVLFWILAALASL